VTNKNCNTSTRSSPIKLRYLDDEKTTAPTVSQRATNLPDADGRLAQGAADGGELGLGVGDGLPQLGPAAARLVHLPPAGLEALLLELQQRPVPLGALLADLVPYHLRRNQIKSAARD
jgi:hypothetical protein